MFVTILGTVRDIHYPKIQKKKKKKTEIRVQNYFASSFTHLGFNFSTKMRRL